MQIAATVDVARSALRDRPSVALVPTMGALHEGHLSLLRSARQLAEYVVVSIFVNPTQFGPGEDFARYPRPVDDDLRMCREAGADMVFQPTAEAIYPPQELDVTIDVPSLTTILEGEHRPGHFIGVCRVVAKLLHIIRPTVACFGMKDYQQLRVVEAMCEGLSMDVRIERYPTVREPDGLAMSSRNIYLDADQRRHALGLSKALREAQELVEQGESSPARVESAMRQVMAAHHVEVDYAVVRNARALGPLDIVNPAVEPAVCLVAGRLGSVRLIDNIVLAA